MQPSRHCCLLASSISYVCFALTAQASAATLLGATRPSKTAESSIAAQSAAITNQDVLEMTQAGLSPIVIEGKITKTPCRFDTSIAALETLRSAGVPNTVLAAMLRCQPEAPPHTDPIVWIGANQERISEGHVDLAESESRSFATAAGNTRAQSQIHSEYADVARALNEKCPRVVVTDKLASADYAITVERYHAGHLATQRNLFTIFRRSDGSLILSDKTTWLKSAADHMCDALLRDASLDPRLAAAK